MPRLPKKIIEVPFDKDDNMMEASYAWHNNVTWKDNYEFDATLRFVSFSYARAGTKYLFEDVDNGARYYVFTTEMEKMIPLMDKGILDGKFTFVKRSTAFGIKLVVD